VTALAEHFFFFFFFFVPRLDTDAQPTENARRGQAKASVTRVTRRLCAGNKNVLLLL